MIEYRHNYYVHTLTKLHQGKRERDRDRDRQTDRQSDRDTDRQTDTGTETDRQIVCVRAKVYPNG